MTARRSIAAPNALKDRFFHAPHTPEVVVAAMLASVAANIHYGNIISVTENSLAFFTR
jgi:hypothetical protein